MSTDMDFRPEQSPLNGAGDGEAPLTSELAEPDASAAPDIVAGADGLPPVGGVPEPEQPQETPVAQDEPERGPPDWNTLVTLAQPQLELRMRGTWRRWDALSYGSWLALIDAIAEVRAYKEVCGGKDFEKKCAELCHISKTPASKIVKYGLAEPHILQEIWDRVHAEKHSADIIQKRYEYPTLNKMLSWYTPPEDKAKDKTKTNADDAEDEDANDKTSLKELRRQIMDKEDAIRALEKTDKDKTQRIVALQQAADDIEEAWAKERAGHLDAANSLAALREQSSADRQAKAELEQQKRDADAALAAALDEIKRLKALKEPSNDNNGEPEPDPDPPGNNNVPEDKPDQGDESDQGDEFDQGDPVEHAPDPPDGAISGMGGGTDENGVEVPFVPSHLEDPMTTLNKLRNDPKINADPRNAGGYQHRIAEMTATKIDKRWGMDNRGGSKMDDVEQVKVTRARCFELLRFVSDAVALPSAQMLKDRKLTFYRQVRPEMTLAEILNLPEKE